MILPVKYGDGGYDINIERGALCRVGELFSLKRRVLIVTDDGVPSEYAEAVIKASETPFKFILKQGEKSKSIENYIKISEALLQNGFQRSDCVVAVGGGVSGDIAGFAASTYMRGIDFYNVPTTLLSQVDSSVGGKTAVDFCGVKNIIGSFYRPKAVLIDPDTLKTLPERQISAGLCEALKTGITSDPVLYSIFSEGKEKERTEEIIYRSLCVKSDVVSKDEKENGLRRILNFGHTIGHGVEAAAEGKLLHGECVGMGMLCMCGEKLYNELKTVLSRMNLPVKTDINAEEIIGYIKHDKKIRNGTLTAVFSDKPGEYTVRAADENEIRERIKRITV